LSSSIITKSFFKRNSNEILIFFILALLSSTFILIQYYYAADESIRKLMGGDEGRYLVVTSTILKHQSFRIDDHFLDPEPDPKFPRPKDFREEFECGLKGAYGHPGPDGHCYSKHSVGQSFVLIPGYFIAGIFGALVQMSVIFGLTGIIVYKFCSKLASTRSAFITTLIMGLATTSFSFSSELYPATTGALVIITILYVLFFRETNFYYGALLGSLLGFLVLLKSTFAIFYLILLPFVIYHIIKNNKNRKSIPTILGFSFIFVLILLVYNLTTNPVESGGSDFYFQFVVEHTPKTLEGHLARVSFGLMNYLVSSFYGLFVFSPLALISIFGYRFLWSKKKEIAMISILLFSLFLIIHGWGFSAPGGHSLPARYLIPTLPLLSLPLVFLIEKFSKNILFRSILVPAILMGFILNVIFLIRWNQHFSRQAKQEIAGFVYFGLSEHFPKQEEIDGVFQWIFPGIGFWILIMGIIAFFLVFVLHPYFKKFD